MLLLHCHVLRRGLLHGLMRGELLGCALEPPSCVPLRQELLFGQLSRQLLRDELFGELRALLPLRRSHERHLLLVLIVAKPCKTRRMRTFKCRARCRMRASGD